jgi:IclR family mhp operon transcriptional activator
MMAGEELQTLKRGLEALRHINAHGQIPVSEIVRAIDLPRATVNRIVATLVAEGYCQRIPNSRLYIVTEKVRQLSMGLDMSAMVTIAALPLFDRLARDVEWPIGLVTPKGSQMVVRLATDVNTPLALLKATPGFLAPMMITSTGLVYLALEDPVVGNRIIREIKADPGFGQFYASEIEFDRYISFAQEHGYLLMEGRFPEGSLGVPILLRSRPVGGLMMRYIRAGNHRDEILECYLPMLREAAKKIEENLRELSIDPHPSFSNNYYS